MDATYSFFGFLTLDSEEKWRTHGFCKRSHLGFRLVCHWHQGILLRVFCLLKPVWNFPSFTSLCATQSSKSGCVLPSSFIFFISRYVYWSSRFRLVHRTHLSFLLVCIVLWPSRFVNSFYEIFLRNLKQKPCGLKAARRKHANTPCQCKKNRLSLYKKALKQNFPALKAGKSIKIRFSRGHAHREKHLWSPPVWPWVALWPKDACSGL